MKCKGLNRACELESGHRGKCMNAMLETGLVRNQIVTIEAVTCNHCVTKDAEIERLRNQIAEMERKPKRDRAAYMRDRRAKLKAGFIGIAYG